MGNSGKPTEIVPAEESKESPTPVAADRGINAIRQMERRSHDARSRFDHLSAAITNIAGSGISIVIHAVWFVFWLVANVGGLPGVRVFDPFPFNLLTLVVSLEATFLTLFVLLSQRRMSRDADKRAHLDLQINILAERETTMILRMLHEMSEHLGVKGRIRSELEDLLKETKIDELAQKLEDALPSQ